MNRLALALVAMSLLASSAFAAAGARTMVADDLYRLVSFANPAFSPDGSKLAVIERRVDVAHDRRRGTLLLIDVGTGAQRPLSFERDGLAAPAFDRRGGSLAFLANDEHHHAQIFVLPLDGGDARRVTATHEGVQQFAWRPDGSALAYITSDDNPKKAEIAKHHDFFDLSDDDYLTTSYQAPSHLWLVPSTGGAPHRLTSGSWSAATSYPPSPPASPLSWSPDGRSLLFTRVPDTRRRRIPIADRAARRGRWKTRAAHRSPGVRRLCNLFARRVTRRVPL